MERKKNMGIRDLVGEAREDLKNAKGDTGKLKLIYSKELRKIIKGLSRIKEVIAIYIFGSYLNNRFNLMSDIDVCVISKGKLDDNIRAEIYSYSSGIFDVSWYWDLPLYMGWQVFKEGKLVFVKKGGEEGLNALKVKAMKEYFDFKRILERHAENLLGVKYE
jgi:predicted nucleotidyltransferase